MQKYSASLIVAGVAALLLAGSTTAFAQSTTTSTGEETSPAAQPEERVPVVPAIIDQLSGETQARITNLTANMSNRADALIQRLENITLRVESRILKMEAEGHDTTDARTYLKEAQDALIEAKAHVAGVDAKVNAFVTAQNYWTGWFEVRDTYLETETVLTRAKKSLLNAVEDMKLAIQDAAFIEIYGDIPLPPNQTPN